MPEARARPRFDRIGGAVFAVLTVAFVILMATSPAFFSWSFARHHNVLSWYVRPLFLIPFCVFAYRRSLAGIAGTLFLLATSMAWFPRPTAPGPSVAEFLAVEADYLTGTWTPVKLITTALVPLTLGALAAALWRRNVALGLVVLVLIAVAKMTWSVLAAGDAGYAIFVPALVGLALCSALVWWAVERPRDPRRRRGRRPE